MMEVPPGRVERISDGGEEAIRAILAELRSMKFNGLLKTSVFRGDTPSQGVLVLRGGDGVLAEHRSKVDIAGPTAVPEILKDASSERAQLEVRTYDYGHSAISIDQLQRSYPEAAVKGLGNADEVLSKVLIQEGPRGAGDPTAEPDGEDREGGGPRAGFRGSAGVPRRSGGVDRDARGIPRAGAPTDERSVCEPPGGNGEDLRSAGSLRHPTRRCRTPGARVNPPRAGEWRGRRPTATTRCRHFRPRENGSRAGKSDRVPFEGPGTQGGEDRVRSRGSREARGSARRPRDDAGGSPRRTRPGDRSHGENRKGTGHEEPQGGRGRTRGAAAARGSPTP